VLAFPVQCDSKQTSRVITTGRRRFDNVKITFPVMTHSAHVFVGLFIYQKTNKCVLLAFYDNLETRNHF